MTRSSLATLRRRLLAWYAVEQRDFPWRRTSDPWAVLVSEVMLQQTQASRVAERFGPFMERFPTAASMASTTDAEALAAWSGLGYNRRALALRRTATAVARDGWPNHVEGLEALPGVGPYTARAVAALAFGRPVGAVDTNVRRWLVRRLGLPVEAPMGTLQEIADALAAPAVDAASAAAWMHASMEFGARVCSARSPRCDSCPIARGCPSRGLERIVPVVRQAAFAGSMRERRGRVLRSLATADGHRLSLAKVASLAGDDALEALLGGLERDGLAHRARGELRLGSREPPTAVATIGA